MGSRVRSQSRRPRGSPGRWLVVGVVGLAAVVVAGLIWMAETGGERVAVSNHGNVKGDPAAPVVVEEWGDFQ